MNNTSKNARKKRPGPLSKTKNKEYENDQVELVYLDVDDGKKAEENGTIIVSADTFNNFEDSNIKNKPKPPNTSKPEFKFVRTYARIDSFPCMSTNTESQTEKNETKPKTNAESALSVVNGQMKQKPNEISSRKESEPSKISENNYLYPELSIEPIKKIKNAQPARKSFEEIVIKGEIHESVDKTTDNTDIKVGEPQFSAESSPSVVNKPTSTADVKKNNRVFIIKNLSGKQVTLIPKSTPVVINNSAISSTIHKTTTENKPTNKTIKVIKPNKSQTFINESSNYCTLKIQKTESLFAPQKIIEQIDLTGKNEDKVMKNNVQSNTMPGFSKILQVLAGNPSQESKNSKLSPIEDAKIPIYVDNQTQTDSVVVLKDKSVQTEVFMPSPTPSIEDLPNITNLLEYVFSTPKYSTGLDEVKKSDLIDMSKNIVMKGKIMSQVPKGEDGLKRQLFMDLKDCATFDFLGNKPIHNAVLENNIKFLKRQIFALRLRKISVDIENNQGQTALQLAIIHNCNMDIITTLLLNGASANILDNEGNTLIHLAVINSTHIVLELIIKYLVDPVKEINRKNDEGLTALMIASIDSKPEMVDMLLRNKADPNLRDEKSGRTALFHAVELNCNFVINLLLKYRADPKVRNYFGLTALDAAKDLDLADSKILETEKDPNLSNQTSVIVNMSAANKANETTKITPGNKRGRPSSKQSDESKKSKLSFVPSYQKVQINNVKNKPASPGNSSGNGRRKKK